MQFISVDIEHHVLEVQHVCGRPSGFNDRDDFDIFGNEGGVVCKPTPGEQ